ncbi:MAG: MFS transporter, partial [Phenylobacterium sp.]
MTDAVSKGSPLTAPTATASVASGPFSAAYTRYALWLLLGLSVVNFIDRSIVNILAEPIKKELGLHDWQLGVMTGLGFAVVYTLCGLPIARLAERRNRSLIITASAVVWGGFTFLCGSAQSFAQLLLYRTGVGLGEAGYGPTAVSLISDYVSPAKRASSLAFYAMGAPIGGLMGLALGGIVADAYGWRGAFLLVGLPALILAALAFFTLREPRKLLASQAAKNQETKATFGETLRSLGGKRAYWLVMLGAATKTFINLGHAPFVVSFFLRNHGHEISGLASHIGLLSIGFLGLATG